MRRPPRPLLPFSSGLLSLGPLSLWLLLAGTAQAQLQEGDVVVNTNSGLRVYRPDGTLLGEIRDPSVFPTKFYGTGRAAVLDRDELDVQRVVVLQLREQSGP